MTVYQFARKTSPNRSVIPARDHDRDINAARNTKAAGLTVLTHREPVNPTSLDAAQVRLG
ncbi:hypothetical protein C1N72_08765 [Pantoea ananatis]